MRNFDYRWDEKEERAIERVIESKKFTMGKEVCEFEKKIAEYFGRRYAVMVNSGSSANLIGIASMIYDEKIDLRPGDEVIVPMLSWSTTYSPLLQYGLKLVFVDISGKDFNIDLERIEKAITDKTKMVMAVNILGNPINYDKLENICNEFGLYIFVDNCEGMGAKYKGDPVEKKGIIATVSTFFSHQISTMEGGIAFTDDYNLYNLMKSLRAHGWTRDTNLNCSDEFYGLFTFAYPGYNVRPLEIEAAVGKCQLDKLEGFMKIRRKNAELYRKYFSKCKYVDIQEENGESAWFGFPFIIKDNAPYCRKNVVEKILAEKIEVRPIVSGNFLLHPTVQFYDYRIVGEEKVVTQLHNRGFFIYNDILDMAERFEIIKKILEYEG